MARLIGGDGLARALNRIANTVGRPVVRAGIFESAKYPDGTPVAQIAVYQEFGTPNARFPAPPRPFFRPVIRRGERTWGPALGRALQANNFDGRRAMEILGDLITGELRQSIIAVQDPPLSEVTLMLRWMKRRDPSLVVTRSTVFEAIGRLNRGKRPGRVSTKPLVDSGFALSRISYEVGSGWTLGQTTSSLTGGP